MASRYGSLSRSLISTARASAVRSAPSLPRLRPPPALGSGLNSRRLLTTANIGTIGGVIGCTQSLLPLHSVVAASRLTSHIAVECYMRKKETPLMELDAIMAANDQEERLKLLSMRDGNRGSE